jgi:hypothetical protein
LTRGKKVDEEENEEIGLRRGMRYKKEVDKKKGKVRVAVKET